MRHLSAERLAAIADEPPTPDESAHLAHCAPCTDGRDAHRRLIAGAALERDRPVTPLSDWGALSARLRAEGMVRTPESISERTTSATEMVPPASAVLPFVRRVATVPDAKPGAAPAVATRRRAVPAWAMRAAAGLALLAGGVLAGRASAPVQVASAPTGSAQHADSGAVTPAAAPGSVALVSQVQGSPAFFQSTEEAKAAMLQAERTYQAAMQYLAANDSTLRPPVVDPVNAYRARLAALDDAVEATRRALKHAPADPVMNSYYLTSVSARETTLRQIDDALPVNERVTRF